MLKLGLDLRALDPNFKAHAGRGTGRYVREVTQRLLSSAYQEKARACGIQIQELSAARLGHGSLSAVFKNLVPIGRITLEQQLLLPRRIQQTGIDKIHFFAHGDSPSRLKIPSIITVLDLIPLRFPELYKADRPSWRFHLARYFELQAIKNAERIIAISEATKRDLIEILEIPKERIFVTPLAVGTEFRARPSKREAYSALQKKLRDNFGIPSERDLLIYIGGIDPRKNIPFLLEVFAQLLHANKTAGVKNLPYLCLAGPYENDRHFPALQAKIKQLQLSAEVKLLGFVPESKLIELYHAATLVVFPSLYEGFGLPVLEAMNCGVPVICGNNSSLPEVLGTTGLLARDSDIDDWTSKINQVLSSIDLQEKLANDGLERCNNFSWEYTADQTLAAYSSKLNFN
ncbi:glycosyltransferase family 4 protein [bacterium]|nr:glycosyltransferase family 4 protein [bacterium]